MEPEQLISAGALHAQYHITTRSTTRAVRQLESELLAHKRRHTNCLLTSTTHGRTPAAQHVLYNDPVDELAALVWHTYSGPATRSKCSLQNHMKGLGLSPRRFRLTACSQEQQQPGGVSEALDMSPPAALAPVNLPMPAPVNLSASSPVHANLSAPPLVPVPAPASAPAEVAAKVEASAESTVGSAAAAAGPAPTAGPLPAPATLVPAAVVAAAEADAATHPPAIANPPTASIGALPSVSNDRGPHCGDIESNDRNYSNSNHGGHVHAALGTSNDDATLWAECRPSKRLRDNGSSNSSLRPPQAQVVQRSGRSCPMAVRMGVAPKDPKQRSSYRQSGLPGYQHPFWGNSAQRRQSRQQQQKQPQQHLRDVWSFQMELPDLPQQQLQSQPQQAAAADDSKMPQQGSANLHAIFLQMQASAELKSSGPADLEALLQQLQDFVDSQPHLDAERVPTQHPHLQPEPCLKKEQELHLQLPSRPRSAGSQRNAVAELQNPGMAPGKPPPQLKHHHELLSQLQPPPPQKPPGQDVQDQDQDQDQDQGLDIAMALGDGEDENLAGLHYHHDQHHDHDPHHHHRQDYGASPAWPASPEVHFPSGAAAPEAGNMYGIADFIKQRVAMEDVVPHPVAMDAAALSAPRIPEPSEVEEEQGRAGSAGEGLAKAAGAASGVLPQAGKDFASRYQAAILASEAAISAAGATARRRSRMSLPRGNSLVLELQATGEPRFPKCAVPQPHLLNMYDKARIVSIGWRVLGPMPGLQTLREAHHIVEPDGFLIPQEAVDRHGVTNVRAFAEGIPIGEALAHLMQDLQGCEDIVSNDEPNDLGILLSELFGLERLEDIMKVASLRQM